MHSNATAKELASPDNFGIVDPTMNKVAEARSLKVSQPRRTIGFVTACSIVIANIIGTGIFTSLGFQVAEIQSGFALLMLWIIGAFLWRIRIEESALLDALGEDYRAYMRRTKRLIPRVY